MNKIPPKTGAQIGQSIHTALKGADTKTTQKHEKLAGIRAWADHWYEEGFDLFAPVFRAIVDCIDSFLDSYTIEARQELGNKIFKSIEKEIQLKEGFDFSIKGNQHQVVIEGLLRGVADMTELSDNQKFILLVDVISTMLVDADEQAPEDVLGMLSNVVNHSADFGFSENLSILIRNEVVKGKEVDEANEVKKGDKALVKCMRDLKKSEYFKNCQHYQNQDLTIEQTEKFVVTKDPDTSLDLATDLARIDNAIIDPELKKSIFTFIEEKMMPPLWDKRSTGNFKRGFLRESLTVGINELSTDIWKKQRISQETKKAHFEALHTLSSSLSRDAPDWRQEGVDAEALVNEFGASEETAKNLEAQGIVKEDNLDRELNKLRNFIK